MSRMIMIDLETFGSAPGCSIASIGAVAASHDGFVQDTLY
jgi:DNA polymerase III epsilon subunit-like protein